MCFLLLCIFTVGTSKTTVQNQAPLVAKVLTNAAGQVISVESLLAHQKQHGTLPQGEHFLLLLLLFHTIVKESELGKYLVKVF